MGYNCKVNIKKFEGQSNFVGVGEKNFQIYDKEFESSFLE